MFKAHDLLTNRILMDGLDKQYTEGSVTQNNGFIQSCGFAYEYLQRTNRCKRHQFS